jgi:hypothetical protein
MCLRRKYACPRFLPGIGTASKGVPALPGFPDSVMSVQLFQNGLNGNTNEDLELIRFECRDGDGILIDRKVTISKFRPYGEMRNSAVNAGHEIKRHTRVR